MAKIETINYNPNNAGDTAEIINVSATVGTNGVNNQDDVIVVQALLKYALEERVDFRDVTFPEPSGTYSRATALIIKKFQRYNNRSFGKKVSIDGRIDPAKGGAFAFGTRKHWTIYSLHVEALGIALISGDISPIEGICRRWPFIRKILNPHGVGTLGLELE